MTRELTIGRSPDSDILIPDSSVSRQHAILIISDSSFSVRDSGSSNGTYINGMRINGISKIQKNDILKVGNELVPWMNYVNMAGADLKTEYKKIVSDSHKNQIKQDLPNASAAQTCGIIGLIFSVGLIGIVLNIIALSLAGGAISKYRTNLDNYTEKSFRKAKAGQTLGIIGLSLFGFILLLILIANG